MKAFGNLPAAQITVRTSPSIPGQSVDDFIAAVLARDALAVAWERVRRNAGAAGADGVTCDAFAARVDAELRHLSDDVAARIYEPPPLRVVDYLDNNGKRRTLAIPSVSDRVLQTAAAHVLGPWLERSFRDCSYGIGPADRSRLPAPASAGCAMTDGTG